MKQRWRDTLKADTKTADQADKESTVRTKKKQM